jgi:hydroxymethylglutaryl-CoA reductase (NADPH)
MSDDGSGKSPRIPRDRDNDSTEEAAGPRRSFLEDRTGSGLRHMGHSSLDPASLPGNVENFFGVAQVPVGLAGPLRIDGEHARGDFYVPLATTEGTLVASYSRGMRLLTECGGVKTTIVEQAMQRAPVFYFDDARQARAFGAWVEEHFDQIRDAAEATTRTGRLIKIEQYSVGAMKYLRFNFTTGDAAGQNMVGKATFAACEWIRRAYPGGADYVLSGNIDTDKKHSHINILNTRGRRVVAEVVIPDEICRRILGVDTATLFRSRQFSNVGAILSGAANNGAHAANGITAIFIATGQDVANVSESHAAIVYTQRRDNGDYYWSITLPSLIVATYGGGTGLPTQREALELLGCYGTGKADKLAEIVAATVLAGETSLSGAILAGDWVSSHELLGRNRP